MIDIEKEIRAASAYAGVSMAKATGLYNDKYGTKHTPQSISRKLKTGAIRFHEAAKLLDLFGVDVVLKRRES